MKLNRILRLVCLITASLGTQKSLFGQTNPFNGFETHVLPNGLTLWFKQLEGQPRVSVSVTVPAGSLADPPGYEQLAHFLEHMMFADHLGYTEDQIRKQIEDLGGETNAFTASDKTFYYVRIGQQHGLYAIEWLHRIMSPHEHDQATIDRQRTPVALEVRARPRNVFDWIGYYMYPPALRVPLFWEREFGIETYASRDYYPYRSLHRMGPDDFRAFYEQYYSPTSMTVTVIGDLDREAVFDQVSRTFGALQPTGGALPRRALMNPRRQRRVFFWAPRQDVYYSTRFKFYDLTAQDDMMLSFVEELLSERLNRRLRFGDRKAGYTIRVWVRRRGPAVYLEIWDRLEPGEFQNARNIIDSEIETLRNGSIPEEEFEVIRQAIETRVKTSNATPERLERWLRRLYYPPRHHDFPDIGTAFETVTRDDVAHFASRFLIPEHQVLVVVRPVSIYLLIALLVSVVVGTIQVMKRLLVRTVDMRRVVYVAKLKPPLVLKITAGGLYVVTATAVIRIAIYLYQQLTDGFLITIESLVVQWSAFALMLASLVALVVLSLALVPRKVLVFDDKILLKHVTYRSTLIGLEEVAEVGLLKFRDVWLSSRIKRCLALALGISKPAVYLRTSKGRAYYLNVRDNGELTEVIKNRIQAAQPSAGIA